MEFIRSTHSRFPALSEKERDLLLPTFLVHFFLLTLSSSSSSLLDFYPACASTKRPTDRGSQASRRISHEKGGEIIFSSFERMNATRCFSATIIPLTLSYITWPLLSEIRQRLVGQKAKERLGGPRPFDSTINVSIAQSHNWIGPQPLWCDSTFKQNHGLIAAGDAVRPSSFLVLVLFLFFFLVLFVSGLPLVPWKPTSSKDHILLSMH